MKLWKVDQSQWTVRQVDGERYPGKDSEGDTCFDNTHFVKEEPAWLNLMANAEAMVKMSGESVRQAECALVECNRRAGQAAKWYAAAVENRRRRESGSANG